MSDRTPLTPPVILPVPSRIKRPLWSVMIPTYNCISYLKEAMEGVLAQDPGEDKMQIEVVDDCSTDGDVKALVHEIGKGRVGYFRQQKNRGSLRNFETCLIRATGHWVHLLHGDDTVAPGFYREIEALFKAHPEAGAAFTNYSLIDNQGAVLNIVNEELQEKPGIIKDFVLQICRRQLIQPPAIVVKRKVYETIGSFYGVHFGEDWEMWSRIASRFAVAYSPRTLANYRVLNHLSISFQSFLTGQNIKDIIKVINIIQGYVPVKERKKIKKVAREYYSIYCIKVANGQLGRNTRVASLQVKGALRMSRSLKTYYWALRFYLMYVFRFKQLQKLFQKK